MTAWESALIDAVSTALFASPGRTMTPKTIRANLPAWLRDHPGCDEAAVHWAAMYLARNAPPTDDEDHIGVVRGLGKHPKEFFVA